MTDSTWLTLYAGKILSLPDLETHLADSLRERQRLHQADLWGDGGVLGGTKATFTYGASMITLAADREAWTGTGYRLLLDAGAAAWTSIPFANAAATVYYVGARWNDYPGSVESGADGALNYGYTIEGVGELGTADAVAVVGSTIVLTISTLAAPEWTVNVPRPVKVWLTSGPRSAAYSTAVYAGTALPDAGVVKVTVPHYLGQTTPSTTAGDYTVLLEGPRITTTDIRAALDYTFLGTVTSGVWDDTDQNLLDSYGTWVSAFLAEHLPTGQHAVVDADRVLVRGSGTKIRTDAVDVPDEANAAFQALDAAGAGKVLVYVSEGGQVSFPNAQAGAGARFLVSSPMAGTVTLSVTNPRSSTDYADIAFDGVHEWIAAKSGNTWAMQTDQPVTTTYRVRNIGAGVANLDVENNGIFGGSVYGGAYEITGAFGRLYFATAQDLLTSFPCFAGWQVINGALEVDTSTTPPKVRSASGTAPVTIAKSLQDWWKDGADEQIVINAFSVMHQRGNVAASITATIYRAPNTGAGARSVVSTLTASSTAGTWGITGMSATGIGHSVVAGYVYWIEVTIDPSAANTEVEVETVNISATQVVVR